MRSKIFDLWLHVHASYWFIPSIMALIAVFCATGFVYVDSHLGSDWLLSYDWIHASKPAGARALLSTVAGSMITVAGVTFSMTLLAVSHASAQIGPRLLTGFMRDRGNQFTLGTFIATFLYCLLVLRTIHTTEEAGQDGAMVAFVPHLAIMVAVGLAMLSVAVLIFFIHHVPQSISVSNVVSRVGDELLHGIQQMYPTRMGTGMPSKPAKLPERFDSDKKMIRIEGRAGYLRILDADTLVELATEHDLIVEMLQRPGSFAVAGQPLMQVWPAERCTDERVQSLRAVYSWGIERTKDQDVMFPADQLIEVLGKAMSPGVNNQNTAILCINQFERAFAELLQRSGPEPYRVDDDGDIRVITNPISPTEHLADIQRSIRQYVRNDWIATRHLLDSLQRLRDLPLLESVADIISKEIDLLEDEVRASSMVAAEKEQLLAASGQSDP